MSISAERLEEMAGQILQIYDEAEQTMMQRVARRAARGVDDPGWTETKYHEMTAVRKEIVSFVGKLSADRRGMQERFLQEAYEDGQSQMISDARRYADLAGIEHLTPNAIKVVNIMSELDGGMSAADRQILRSVDDAYADIVGRTSALMATGTVTAREAVRRELNEFADRGIRSFTDRAGRVWDMETYAEMATLTAIERASREGYMDMAREFGYDLVMISDHYGACPICEAWQGVVVSIDGKTPGYLTLADAEAAGVFHPRCMHDYSVYYEGISKEGRIGPREVKEPNAGYTARSQQRYFERQERQWKRRMAVATTPEDERAAYARVRMYQQKIRDLREAYNATTPRNVDYLPRQYWREGGKAPKLSEAAKKIRPMYSNLSQRIANAMRMSVFEQPTTKAVTISWPTSGTKITREQFKALRKYAAERRVTLRGFRDSDVNVELATEVVDAVQMVAKDFPKIVSSEEYPLVLSLAPLRSADFAEILDNERNVIRLNMDAYRDKPALIREYAKAVAEGQFVKGTKEKSIAFHELGHMVSDYYGIDGMEIMKQVLGTDSEAEVLMFCTLNLSKYAGSHEEITAECFSAYYGLDDPPKFVVDFMQCIL